MLLLPPLWAALITLRACMDVNALTTTRAFTKAPNCRLGTTKHSTSSTTILRMASISNQPTLWNIKNLDSYADRSGMTISFTTLGPGYRAVARAKHDESLILGYVEGFVRPAGQILHLDKMEIFQPILQRAKRGNPDGFDFGGISFGIGLVLGYRCLLHGKYSADLEMFSLFLWDR